VVENETGPARNRAGQANYQAENSLHGQGNNRALPGQTAWSAQVVATGTASRPMRT